MAFIEFEKSINLNVCMDPRYTIDSKVKELLPDIVISYGGNIFAGIKEELRKCFDKMVTYGKKGTLVSRRKALAFLHNDEACVSKIFNELAPRYKDRNGGYTRILKMTERKGDNALEVIIELV